jgi:oligoribonuclease
MEQKIMDNEIKLVWIDLEMTGLDPDIDVIVEMATIVTDSNLNIIEEGPAMVIYQSDDELAKMGPWVRELHTKTGLVDEIRKSTVSIKEAEEKTMLFLREHCQPRKSFLCGNSVWNDRIFMSKQMPEIVSFLHYRLVDITSIKLLVQCWYPNDPHIEFVKKDVHRALSDIRESIAELRHYRKYFFV